MITISACDVNGKDEIVHDKNNGDDNQSDQSKLNSSKSCKESAKKIKQSSPWHRSRMAPPQRSSPTKNNHTPHQ